jgi:hypothetical protein
MFERVRRIEELDEVFESTANSPITATRAHAPYVVGDANDVAEHRADTVADRGMATLQQRRASNAPSMPTSAEGTRIRRSVATAAVGQSGGEVDQAMSSELDNAVGRGRSFEPTVQRAVEQATGQEVGDVRIHTDAHADRMAHRIQANAFTVNRNVFFAAGQYRPDTSDGMHQVLHESAHLMESRGPVRRNTIRRQISVTTNDLDGSFKHRTGVAGLRASMSGAEIPKIRDGLKSYHSAKGKGSEKKKMAALQSLVKHTDSWLAKHSRASDAGERARIDLIDSIRTQASMEYARAQAEAIYMGDASVKANNSAASKQGPGSHPLQNLSHTAAFKDGSTLYDDRSSTADAMKGGGKAKAKRDQLVGAGELGAADAATTKAMDAALQSLSPAEHAAINTYTGADYRYINPNTGGWGVGDFGAGKDSKVTADVGKANRQKYEEAGLHGGFMAEAFRKLPIWKGTTYRGMTMEQDFLGLTTGSAYTPKEFWSTSEARSVAKNFLNVSAMTAKSEGKNVKIAAMCTISVSNARDVSRLSDAPEELEVLLPPSSQLTIGTRTCLVRGKDDDVIKQKFGDTVFNTHPNITEFWLIDLTQRFSGDDDVVGAYAPMKAPKGKPKPARKGLPAIPSGGMPALPKSPGA